MEHPWEYSIPPLELPVIGAELSIFDDMEPISMEKVEELETSEGSSGTAKKEPELRRSRVSNLPFLLLHLISFSYSYFFFC
jgi:hypothetical protein